MGPNKILRESTWLQLDVPANGKRAVGVIFRPLLHDEKSGLNHALQGVGTSGNAAFPNNWAWTKINDIGKLENITDIKTMTPISDFVKEATWKIVREGECTAYFTDEKKAILCMEAFKSLRLISLTTIAPRSQTVSFLPSKTASYSGTLPNIFSITAPERAVSKMFGENTPFSSYGPTEIPSMKKIKELLGNTWVPENLDTLRDQQSSAALPERYTTNYRRERINVEQVAGAIELLLGIKLMFDKEANSLSITAEQAEQLKGVSTIRIGSGQPKQINKT